MDMGEMQTASLVLYVCVCWQTDRGTQERPAVTIIEAYMKVQLP